jgi:hypothetical protein
MEQFLEALTAHIQAENAVFVRLYLKLPVEEDIRRLQTERKEQLHQALKELLYLIDK